tara:strand:- start:3074 stop:4138 length:1065 start_codon:yes stop_codon:yes gene_type:complete
MDGYALGQANQPQMNDTWLLKGRSAPGDPFPGELQPGTAIQILTGAPLPKGAGWVLPQELVNIKDQELTLIHKASATPWIRAADEECSPGDQLLDAGHRLSPALLARLAGCGVGSLTIHRQPRVGLLISGDELIPAGNERSAGTIWESNSTLLSSLLKNLDYRIDQCHVRPDQPEALKQSLQDLTACCDVVVSTGGVSTGDSDWIRPLVRQLGSISFWKLFIKPGRPFAFGQLNGGVPFFGLPGNPVAAAVVTLQLLWPALQRLEGQSTPELFPRVMVELAETLPRRSGRPELARAQLDVTSSGRLMARLDGSQASSRIGSLLNADLLLEIPAEAETLNAGERLWAQLLRRSIL